MRGQMRKYAIALFAAIMLAIGSVSAARADDVGAVFGGVTGMFVAGPVGAVVGVIVGEVWGRPFWGPHSPDACWIDERFHRICPAHLPYRVQ